MKKKIVRLPYNIESALATSLLQSRTGAILSNWAAQGMRYMNRDERLYRIFVEVSVIALLTLVLIPIFHTLTAVILSAIVVHTLFWLFNGHFFVLMRYVIDRSNRPAEFLSYIESIHDRVEGRSFLLAAAAYGSLSVGRFNATSDFDLRLFRRRGFASSIKAFTFCAKERARAFISGFPLDVYVFDLEEVAVKINPDENPIVMYDPDHVFSFHTRSFVSYADFRETFKNNICNIA